MRFTLERRACGRAGVTALDDDDVPIELEVPVPPVVFTRATDAVGTVHGRACCVSSRGVPVGAPPQAHLDDVIHHPQQVVRPELRATANGE